MPSLTEVLNVFSDRSFLIHIKSNDPREGLALARTLQKRPLVQQRGLMVYGGDRPVEAFRHAMPKVRTMSLRTEKQCLKGYAALGEFGYLPQTCRSSVLMIPANIAPWLWGWPNRFLKRMTSVGTPVFVVDDLAPGGSKGLNSAEDLTKLPTNYTGGIWTDRIERVGPLIKATD
jgi:glycerophosphoryl diester phosphodiesterase